MSDKLYAENVNYWKTGQSSADTWIDRTKKQIRQLGGSVINVFYGESDGRYAIYFEFEIAGDRYRVTWPALPSKSRNVKAARIQAATMLYHDIKARCISAAVLGARAAFFSFYLLPNGQTAVEATMPQLMEHVPRLVADIPMLEGGYE